MPFKTKEEKRMYDEIYRRSHAEKMRERGRLWRERNPDRKKAYAKQWSENNKEQLREKKRAYYLAHREDLNRRGRARHAKNAKSNNLKRRAKTTGFTEVLWNLAWALQDGLCAICQKDLSSLPVGSDGRTKVYGDHDHRTRSPRGLLCSKCNSAIGLLFDSPEFCRQAATYLESPPLAMLEEFI